MNFKLSRGAKTGSALATIMLATITAYSALPAFAVDFAHGAFKRTWERTDSLVASGR